MAIEEDRIQLDTITKLNKLDFEEAGANDATTNTTKPVDTSLPKSIQNKEDKKSILEKPTKIEETPINKALGTASDILCDTLDDLPEIIRIDKYAKSNNRKLEKINTKCTAGGTMIDNLLTTFEPVKRLINILPLAKEGRLDEIIKNEMSLYRQYNDNPEFLLNSIKSGLLKTVDSIGGSIKQKLHINEMLKTCNAKNLNKYVNNTDYMSEITLAALLDMITCLGVTVMAKFLQEAIGFNDSSKKFLISSIYQTLKKDNDPNVEDKLLLLYTIKSLDTDAISTLEITTKGITDLVLENINNSKVKSSSPGSDYKNIISSLDALDSNWKKDDEGNTNYYRVKDNKRILELAIKTNLNSLNDVNLNGVVDLDLDEKKTLLVLSAFSKNKIETNCMMSL